MDRWRAHQFFAVNAQIRSRPFQLAVFRRARDSFMGNGEGMSKRTIAAIVRWARLSLGIALRAGAPRRFQCA
jgi:hypothetical protein